ncbi:MAG: hypothetical protein E7466_00555 [Ruminococcaceae bacterium]|nr:hypothetical protein [Oscillospiraceae bacterium]
MMMSLSSYVRRGQRIFRRLAWNPKLRITFKSLGYFLCGLIFSGASLANLPLPLPLSVLCAAGGSWPSLLISMGSGLGYWLFWGSAGAQGLVWTGAGLVISLALGSRRPSMHLPLLMPALAAFSVAFTGLLFQLLYKVDSTPFLMYLLRVCLAFGSTVVFANLRERRDPVTDWLAGALAVLALAQVSPLASFNVGFIAAGALAAGAPFPAAALAGLAMDLSQVTQVPMTAVLCLAFLVRLIPHLPQWTPYAAPALVYMPIAALCGVLDVTPLLPLAIGGGLGIFLPGRTPIHRRRGETGIAQVRLELTAAVLAQGEQLLLETPEYPIDEPAILSRAADRACGSCPCRNNCRDITSAEQLPTTLLHRPLLGTDDLPFTCRKPGRLLLEIRRSQDQYRAIRGDRDRQREYRNALTQQYRFLSEYLQELADQLPRKSDPLQQRFEVDVAVRSTGLEGVNGDRCLWFAGTELNYYVVLCDGMGTGSGAAEEGRTAAAMLRRLLSAGFPPEYALRSLNSLCVLRGRGGSVTADLAQVDLSTGRVALYKWGAAPSYLLTPLGPEKIGTASPPPGLSVTGVRETVDKLSLRRGETLVLLSDGVDGEAAMRRAGELTGEDLGDTVARVMRYGRGDTADDATAAVIRLYPTALST